jgi:hypothetical protein
MTVNGAARCPSCGGRGWKLLSYRRSHERACSTAESCPAIRERVACMACQPLPGQVQDAARRNCPGQ